MRGVAPLDSDLSLHPIQGLDAVRDKWTSLAECSGNLFATWEWATAWWAHFGVEGTLRLTEVRAADGSTQAILPLYLWSKGPLKLLRFIGHGPADQLGPVCGPDDVLGAGRALRSGLDDGYWDCDGFLGETLAGDQGWSTLFGVLATEGSPVLALGASDWDAFLAGLSRNHRRQIRRDERRLAAQFDIRYRLTAGSGGLGDDLDILFRLHDARWEGRSAAAGGRARRAVRAFCAEALRAGWLRLWIMELDGRPAAAWLGFRYGGAEIYYQQGRDPDFAEQNVGGVLQTHTMRAALEAGAGEYHFLRGDEAFKYRFADRDPGLATVALGTSPLGRLAVGSVTALRRSERGRRMIVRYAG